MIINLVLNILVDMLSLLFYAFDPIITLPTIFGVDIDTNLVNAVGWLNRIMETLWPLEVLMYGFLFLLGYYSTKLLLKLFLGSRTPGA